jgi:hypothetical protein
MCTRVYFHKNGCDLPYWHFPPVWRLTWGMNDDVPSRRERYYQITLDQQVQQDQLEKALAACRTGIFERALECRYTAGRP